jgi:chromosome segregation ATPase
MLQVMAIEQGKTDALFEVSPRELYQRVIDTRGDREILERYRDARRQYEDTEKELSQQREVLLKNQVALQTTKREVERLDNWMTARDRVVYLTEILPGARLQEELKRKREVGSQMKTLQKKMYSTENEISALELRLEKLRATEGVAKADLDSATVQEKHSQEVRDIAVTAHACAQADVGQLEKKQTELDAAGPSEGEIEALELMAEEADRGRYRAEQDRDQSATRAHQTGQIVERLRGGLSNYPEAVERTLAELRQRNIPARLVAETVEVAATELAEAAESALGMARYGLLVGELQVAAAVTVARDLRFPGPVYNGAVLKDRTAAGPLTLEAGAPAWLKSWPQSVKLSGNGNWSNDQGVWVTAIEDRVLGESGRRAALEHAERDLAEAREALPQGEAALAAATARQEVERAALKREGRRCELAKELVHLPEARFAAEAAAGIETEAKEQLSAARALVAGAHAAHEVASAELRKMELKHANASEALGPIRSELQTIEAKLAELDETIAGLDATVRPEIRTSAERGELDAPTTIEHDLKEASIKYESLGAPPAETVRDEERVLRANVEESERHVVQREREAEAARSELEKCRSRYLEVVNETLVDYRRRVREIAEIAGVTSEVEIPKLVNDDRLLDEARIGVGFGFDGKDPLPLGDPSFSGGQQVIAGLILLMAMAETERHGFFMLDEPFAHLSLDRIDHVGRFLRSTRSQFIITAPTTLDRAQFDPAGVAIVLQKKRADDPYAPTPIVLVAR